jgi:hypothetical protein
MECTITSKSKESSEKINDTRSCARAILDLKEGYNEIKNALLDITTAGNKKFLANAEAKIFSKNVRQVKKNAALTVLWSRLLQRMKSVSKSL